MEQLIWLPPNASEAMMDLNEADIVFAEKNMSGVVWRSAQVDCTTCRNEP